MERLDSGSDRGDFEVGRFEPCSDAKRSTSPNEQSPIGSTDVTYRRAVHTTRRLSGATPNPIHHEPASSSTCNKPRPTVRTAATTPPRRPPPLPPSAPKAAPHQLSPLHRSSPGTGGHRQSAHTYTRAASRAWSPTDDGRRLASHQPAGRCHSTTSSSISQIKLQRRRRRGTGSRLGRYVRWKSGSSSGLPRRARYFRQVVVRFTRWLPHLRLLHIVNHESR